MRGSQLPDRVSAAEASGLDDRGVDAAEAEGPAVRRVDEPERPGAEAPAELRTPGVRLVGHLDDGGAESEPRARRQVVGAQVEVDVELIACERPLLAVARE